MRADRLLSIMMLLENNVKMTTNQLANKLEVSDRTILRDMDALSTAGVPVVAERGKTGGWKLMDHFRSQLSGLKLDDMKALLILPSEKMLEDLGMQTYGLRLRQKLLASLPSPSKTEGRHFLDKIIIDTGTWKPSDENNTHLKTVQQALWDDKKLQIVYKKADGSSSQRVVSPLGLVAKGSVWYLVALNNAGDYRTFRLSRIVQADMEDDVFIRPEQFQLAEYWKQSKLAFSESLPFIEVEVLVKPAIMGRLTFTDKFVHQVAAHTTLKDGMVAVTLHFNTEEEAIAYVLGFGGAMKLVQPEHLIDKIVQQAKTVIAMYE